MLLDLHKIDKIFFQDLDFLVSPICNSEWIATYSDTFSQTSDDFRLSSVHIMKPHEFKVILNLCSEQKPRIEQNHLMNDE